MKFLRILSLCLLAHTSVIAMDKITDNDNIIIVGGGMSGLIAGYALAKSDIPVAIYEGRDRLGGRTHTHYFNEDKTSFYEEGGTFIDSDHTQAQNLAKELKVDLIKRGYGSHKVTVNFQGEVQTLGKLEKILEKMEKELKEQVDILKSFESDPTRTIEFKSDGKYHSWHQKSLLPFLENLEPVAQNFIQTFYEDETGAPISQAPVYALFWLCEKVGEFKTLIAKKDSSFIPNFLIDKFAYDYTVKGGISTLINKLHHEIAPKTSIHLNHVLKGIRKDDVYTLTFQTEEGEKFVKANKVIMTLPFSVLRNVDIDKSVGLSDYQEKAIATLPYGTNSKIGVSTPSFKNLYDDLLFYVNLDDKIDGWPGHNALTLLIPGEKGQVLNEESTFDIVEGQKNYVQQEYPYIKAFGDIAFKNWFQDPFALGSYSTITINHDLTLGNPHENMERFGGMRTFAEPTGNFFFAGEHTRADGTSGYIEGAIRSGLKVAELVMESMK